MDGQEYVTWARVLTLISGLGWAAWLDHKYRRVPNQFWITWAGPAIFLWTLDIFLQGGEWYVLASASAVVAYASMSVLGKATLKDAIRGSRVDQIVLLWYGISLIGVGYGAYLHAQVDILALMTGSADPVSTLWWTTIATALPILLFDLGWRVRLIHGGADAKALMWVALVIPSWSAMPVFYSESMDSATVALPPALALMIWGGFVFLALPFVMIIRNLIAGNRSPLRLLWHAEMMPLARVMEEHVWLLSELMEMPSGETVVYHRTRAPSTTPSVGELAIQVAALAEHEVEKVWVTRKYPLLVFLWPATALVLLIGGPMAFLMPLLGL